jgi:DHA1 family multidrug resistance protein-like MFS transporter
VAFFVMMGMAIISPVLPLYALSFGVSLALVGLLISAFAVARVLLDIPAGMFSARFGMKRFMLLGLAIIAVSSIFAGLAPDYSTLLAARVFEGIGSAMYTTTSITMVSRLAPKESRGVYLSLYLSMFLLGSVVGPAVGGVVASAFGLAAPFLVYGICGAISFVMVLRWVHEKRHEEEDHEQITFRQLGRLLRRYDLLTINLATFAVFVWRQGIQSTIVPLYAYNNLGMSELQLGVLLTLSAGCNLASMLAAGRLTDVYGRKPFLMAALLLIAVLTFALPFVQDIVALAVVLMAMGFAIGLTGPIAAWITDVTEPDNLGGAMGLFRTIGDLGFVIAPVALAGLAGSATGQVSAVPFIVAGVVILALTLPLLRTADPIAQARVPHHHG